MYSQEKLEAIKLDVAMYDKLEAIKLDVAMYDRIQKECTNRNEADFKMVSFPESKRPSMQKILDSILEDFDCERTVTAEELGECTKALKPWEKCVGVAAAAGITDVSLLTEDQLDEARRYLWEYKNMIAEAHVDITTTVAWQVVILCSNCTQLKHIAGNKLRTHGALHSNEDVEDKVLVSEKIVKLWNNFEIKGDRTSFFNYVIKSRTGSHATGNSRLIREEKCNVSLDEMSIQDDGTENNNNIQDRVVYKEYQSAASTTSAKELPGQLQRLVTKTKKGDFRTYFKKGILELHLMLDDGLDTGNGMTRARTYDDVAAENSDLLHELGYDTNNAHNLSDKYCSSSYKLRKIPDVVTKTDVPKDSEWEHLDLMETLRDWGRAENQRVTLTEKDKRDAYAVMLKEVQNHKQVIMGLQDKSGLTLLVPYEGTALYQGLGRFASIEARETCMRYFDTLLFYYLDDIDFGCPKLDSKLIIKPVAERVRTIEEATAKIKADAELIKAHEDAIRDNKECNRAKEDMSAGAEYELKVKEYVSKGEFAKAKEVAKERVKADKEKEASRAKIDKVTEQHWKEQEKVEKKEAAAYIKTVTKRAKGDYWENLYISSAPIIALLGAIKDVYGDRIPKTRFGVSDADVEQIFIRIGEALLDSQRSLYATTITHGVIGDMEKTANTLDCLGYGAEANPQASPYPVWVYHHFAKEVREEYAYIKKQIEQPAHRVSRIGNYEKLRDHVERYKQEQKLAVEQSVQEQSQDSIWKPETPKHKCKGRAR